MEKKKEDRREPVPSKDELHAKYDVPSEAPGFEGATPQALARALFRPIRRIEQEKVTNND
ncbi:hypothetical protein [Candidatus Palauibacter sp.]|uniref:hypothetical protein n=1 Tax=Candidatus Palauibacter sp. TaxID=3101350 RepID=UPI003B5B9F43